MVTISAFDNEEHAKKFAQQLSEKEIPFELMRHRKGDDSLVTLHVEEEDEDKALEMLSSEAGKARGAVVCSSCGSIAVEFPARPRRSPSAAVVEAIAEKLHIREPGFYCRACHHTWS